MLPSAITLERILQTVSPGYRRFTEEQIRDLFRASTGPLVDPLPTPRWLSPRAELARHIIRLGDQIRLRARPAVRQRLGTIQSRNFTGQLGDVAAEYARLSR